MLRRKAGGRLKRSDEVVDVGVYVYALLRVLVPLDTMRETAGFGCVYWEKMHSSACKKQDGLEECFIRAMLVISIDSDADQIVQFIS